MYKEALASVLAHGEQLARYGGVVVGTGVTVLAVGPETTALWHCSTSRVWGVGRGEGENDECSQVVIANCCGDVTKCVDDCSANGNVTERAIFKVCCTRK